MPNWVDCSESVEEALTRLNLESIANKEAANAAKKLSKLRAEEAPKKAFGNQVLLETMKAEDLAKSDKLYPERGGNYSPSWFSILFKGEGRDGLDKIKCERHIWQLVKKSHLLRIMIDAMRASGCEVNLRRHISCEVCDPSVMGGYDPILNQVVVCQNTARYEGIIQSVLTHELIHMFDYCRNKMDLSDPRHLACTEIRAANLAHCSFMSAWTYGAVTPLNIKSQHQECVKQRATDSVLAVRDISKDEAREIVESVFPKCYGDLEPIGRRIRRSSGTNDIKRAYDERAIFGYI